MGIDPMADAAGQQCLSPYHAMACNPSTLTDPLGLYVIGEAHNGGGVPQYGNEMAMRFPTLNNFMARFVNFGERTALQSIAEQQQMAAEWIKKYYEEATTGGENAQETTESGKGLDYAFDGEQISKGVSNGLDYNQIIFTDKDGNKRDLNIGKVKIIEKKKTLMGGGK